MTAPPDGSATRSTASRVAAAVAREHLRRRGRSLVLLAVLLGVAGGITTVALTGARRASTALDRLVERTDFPDAAIVFAARAPGDVEAIESAPSADRVVASAFSVGLLEAETLLPVPVLSAPVPLRPHLIVEGREADPTVATELTVSERFAGWFGMQVGDTFRHTALTDEEFADLLADRWEFDASGLEVELEVVGIARTPIDVTTDDFPTLFVTPAYHARRAPSPSTPAVVFVHLEPGATVDDVLVEAGLDPDAAGDVVDFAAERDELDSTVGVLTNATLAFGLVALGATVALLAQLAGRLSDQLAAMLPVLHALGLDRRGRRRVTASIAAVPGGVAAAVTVAVAVVGSRWTPVGLAGRIEPAPGIAFHGVGVAFAGATMLTAVVAASVLTSRTGRARPSRAASAAPLARAGSGPVTALAIALATRGVGRRMARTASLAGVVAAVAVVAGGIVFGSTLDRFVDHERAWGRIGDHEVNLPDGVREPTLEVLRAADDVASFLPYMGGTVSMDGRRIEAYWLSPGKGDLTPTVVAGRLPVREGEVTLGPLLLRDSDLGLGDAVLLDGAAHTVVGSALTFNSSDSGGFAEGAFVGGAPTRSASYTAALVRFAEGVDPEAAADALYGDLEFGEPVTPRAVTNLIEIRPLIAPVIAVAVLVGLVALVHVAVSTAGGGRRDLAVMRALGMAVGDLRRSVLLAIGLLVALCALVAAPTGMVLARATWAATIAATGLTVPTALPWLVAGVPLVLAALGLAVGSFVGVRETALLRENALRAE